MRLSCVFIGCLVSFTCCSQTRSESSHGPDRCCYSFSSMKIPVKQVESYQTTHLQCNRNGVIFITKAQKEVCADPTERWVQRLMKLVIYSDDEIDRKAKKANSFRTTEAAPFQQLQKTTLVPLKESHDWTTQASPNTQIVKESVSTRGTTKYHKADELTLVHLKKSHDWTNSDTTNANPNTETVKEPVATRGTTRYQRADESTLVHLKESAFFCVWTEGE